MSKCRRFYGKPIRRLIVSVPMDVVAAVDVIVAPQWNYRHPANGNRSEFIRMAITEKLERDRETMPKRT